jgi:hypothetical protein
LVGGEGRTGQCVPTPQATQHSGARGTEGIGRGHRGHFPQCRDEDRGTHAHETGSYHERFAGAAAAVIQEVSRLQGLYSGAPQPRPVGMCGERGTMVREPSRYNEQPGV